MRKFICLAICLFLFLINFSFLGVHNAKFAYANDPSTIIPNDPDISLSLESMTYITNLKDNFSVSVSLNLPDNIALEDLDFEVCIDSSTFISSRWSLENWAKNDVSEAKPITTCKKTKKYFFQKSGAFSFSASMSDFGFNNQTIWGPKRVYISDTIYKIPPIKSFIVFNGIDQPQKPLDISVLAHFSDTSYYRSSPAEQVKGILSSVGSEGNINKLLKVLDMNKNISLDIDPAIFSDIEYAGQNSDSKLLNFFKTAVKSHPTYYLPYNDTNLSTLAHNEKTLENLGVYDLIAAKKYKDSSQTLAWLDDKYLDETTLNLVKSSKISNIILNQGLANQKAGLAVNAYTPAPKMSLNWTRDNLEGSPINEIAAYIPDAILSNTFSGFSTDENANAEKTTAGRISRFLAESAFINMELPSISRDVLVSFNKGASANFSNDDLNQLTNAVKQASWISFIPFSQVTNQPFGGKLNLPTSLPNPAEMTQSDINTIYSNLDKISSFSEGTKLYNPVQNFIYNYAARLLSNSLEDDIDHRNQLFSELPAVTNSLLDTVKINTSESLNILASDIQFPVNIKNTLDKKISLNLCIGHNSYIVPKSDYYPIELEANSQVAFSVPLHARANGSSVLDLSLQSLSGKSVGNSAKVSANIFVQFTYVGTIIFFVLLPILFVVGIIRTVKKQKNLQTRQKSLN
ncbi:MAG: DUF6049 family protein [Bifidobacteriaceae bacterium]|nr:DUF6049 family protein [Bifidobacteriaceae bacterium]